jgi:hypothetical protein
MIESISPALQSYPTLTPLCKKNRPQRGQAGKVGNLGYFHPHGPKAKNSLPAGRMRDYASLTPFLKYAETLEH